MARPATLAAALLASLALLAAAPALAQTDAQQDPATNGTGEDVEGATDAPGDPGNAPGQGAEGDEVSPVAATQSPQGDASATEDDTTEEAEGGFSASALFGALFFLAMALLVGYAVMRLGGRGSR